jgi:protein O-mannosyl-transferase
MRGAVDSKSVSLRAPTGVRGAGSAPRPRIKPLERTLPSLVLSVLIVAAGLLAYANSFQGAFVLDDQASIVGNPSFMSLRPLWKAMGSPKNTTVAGRPVVSLTLAVDHVLGREAMSDVASLKGRMWVALGNGQALLARGFHVTNLLIHLLAALTLFALVRRTLRQKRLAGRYGDASLLLAWAVALLWVVHPLHVVSVTYLSQRAESLMGLFYLLTLYCAVRGFERPGSRLWPVLSIAACLLGMGSKEVMASAPVAVLLYDRIFVSSSFREALRARRGFYAGLAATWILLLALVVSGPRSASVGFGRPEMGVLGYVKFQFLAIFIYLRQAIWPQKLIFDYGQGPVPGLSQYALPMVVVILLVLATIVALLKRPAVGYAGACFLMILAPSSSILPIVTERISYHRMYLPLAALVAVVVVGAYELGRRVEGRGVWRWAPGVMLTVLVVLGLGRATRDFNGIFRSEEAVWADVASKMPENERAQNNYGRLLADRGRVSEAIPYFKRAADLKPDYSDPWNNLGVSALRQGNSEQAVSYFAKALEITPMHVAANMNMGDALMEVGRSGEAVPYYESALRGHSDLPNVMSRLAWILAAHPDPQVRNGGRAVEIAERLCATAPDNPGYLNTLAAAYAEVGDWEAAVVTGNKSLASCRRMLSSMSLDPAGSRDMTNAMGVMESHLRDYQARTPIRDTSLNGPR